VSGDKTLFRLSYVLPCAGIALALPTLSALGVENRPADNRGFLEDAPVFVHSEADVPLTQLGAGIPSTGTTVPDVDIQTVSSGGFRQHGQVVQPLLKVTENSYRIGVIRGYGAFALGLSVRYVRNHVIGAIGGFPASGVAEGWGDLSLIGKRILWCGPGNGQLVFSGGIEIPTGEDNSIFGQSNVVTKSYYASQRLLMPIGWQPGTGTVNGYLTLAYRGGRGRLSYEGNIACKLFTPGVEDSKIGDILIVGGPVT